MAEKKNIDDIIDYLEEELVALESESKFYDSKLDVSDMNATEVDHLILRKRIRDLSQYIRVIRRLTGRK